MRARTHTRTRASGSTVQHPEHLLTNYNCPKLSDAFACRPTRLPEHAKFTACARVCVYNMCVSNARVCSYGERTSPYHQHAYASESDCVSCVFVCMFVCLSRPCRTPSVSSSLHAAPYYIHTHTHTRTHLMRVVSVCACVLAKPEGANGRTLRDSRASCANLAASAALVASAALHDEHQPPHHTAPRG